MVTPRSRRSSVALLPWAARTCKVSDAASYSMIEPPSQPEKRTAFMMMFESTSSSTSCGAKASAAHSLRTIALILLHTAMLAWPRIALAPAPNVTAVIAGAMAVSIVTLALLVGWPAAWPAAARAAHPGAPPSTPMAAHTPTAVSPATVEVKVGQAVAWKNDDSSQHTVSGGRPGAKGPFDKKVDGGGTTQVVFDTAGTFDYFCEFHPSMTGKVTVR